MRQTQNYGPNRAESTPIVSTAESADTIYLPLLVFQTETVSGEPIPSEVQLAHASLVHFRDFLAGDNTGHPTTKANLDTLNELIRNVQSLCFAKLSELSILVTELNERRP
ncbi:hypothetical protein [Fibrella forsythiae]|uniref:Uncharacterized protein n=1 Tax=Fibrella forsythiae TaxID=2817061 RepID=A0ABS3JB87_9BACT|nr:hypothetical protein [Fibrella forsythiae]MBO0947255.1 hypothetical protein [Fibrella forsythiae]